MSIKHVKITEEEHVALIMKCRSVTTLFGPGWVALKWDTDKPIPEELHELLLMRGILNENLEGAGI